jgi:hypothetical protein
LLDVKEVLNEDGLGLLHVSACAIAKKQHAFPFKASTVWTRSAGGCSPGGFISGENMAT